MVFAPAVQVAVQGEFTPIEFTPCIKIYYTKGISHDSGCIKPIHTSYSFKSKAYPYFSKRLTFWCQVDCSTKNNQRQSWKSTLIDLTELTLSQLIAIAWPGESEQYFYTLCIGSSEPQCKQITQCSILYGLQCFFKGRGIQSWEQSSVLAAEEDETRLTGTLDTWQLPLISPHRPEEKLWAGPPGEGGANQRDDCSALSPPRGSACGRGKAVPYSSSSPEREVHTQTHTH